MKRGNLWAASSVALLTGLLLVAPLGAQAKDPFPVTPKLIDRLNDPDAEWPHDPAVPDLPPLPSTDEPPPPKDNWLATHAFDGIHPPQKEFPAPLTAPVNEKNPLAVDVIWSMRSPYSYLSLQRLLRLNSNYNVDLTVSVEQRLTSSHSTQPLLCLEESSLESLVLTHRPADERKVHRS